MPSDTPTPPRTNRIDRDPTPELRSNRSHSHRAPTEERDSSRRDSHKESSSHRRSTRDYTPDEDDEEEARHRRRRRDRERALEDAIEDADERRARRSERHARERAEEEERAGERSSIGGGGESKRRRDRSRDSHRSGGRERSGRDEGRSERGSREQREYERHQRDRAMQDERREREEYYARQDRERGGRDRRDDRSPPRRRRRHSPSYDGSGGRAADALLDEIDSEARSVCVSQLAAKLTSEDLGMFFEDKLGEGAVRDAKVVTDRISRRSKGIGYVELDALELVERALKLTGEVVMGLPILVELTEAQRNKQARNVMPGFGPMDGRPPLTGPGSLPLLPTNAGLPAGPAPPGAPPAALHRDRFAGAEIPYHRLYVGSLHFDLSAEDLKQVFAPFGEIEFVDLHRDAITGKSKGFCFVQYFDVEAAKTALQTMNGFELAGRQLRVSTVNEKQTGGGPPRPAQPFLAGVPLPLPGNAFQQQPGTGANASVAAAEGNKPESLDEHHGPRMDHAMRQSLMMKLARQDTPAVPAPAAPSPSVPQSRPNIPVNPSLYVLVSNVFDPAEETERDWDTDLAEDIKGEVEAKYGPVVEIKVEKESRGEVYIQFDTVESAAKGVAGLNGRFFGGRSLVAHFLPEAIFKAHF